MHARRASSTTGPRVTHVPPEITWTITRCSRSTTSSPFPGLPRTMIVVGAGIIGVE